MSSIAFVMIVIVSVTITGDWFLKLALLRRGWCPPHFRGGGVMFVLSAVGFVYLMRHATLASVGVLSAVTAILAIAALGVRSTT